MKKAFQILTLMLVATLAACASHDSRPAPPDPEQRMDTLQKKLMLTDEQVKLVRPILEEAHRKQTEIMGAPDESRRETSKAQREKMEDLEWETYKKLAEYLSDEQMELYSKFLEEESKRHEGKQPPEGGRGPGGPGRRGPM